MKTIIVKIGTKLLTTENGQLDLNNLRTISNAISRIQKDLDLQCILVSSGSITCGSESLNIRPKNIPEKQACASVGQLMLLKEYHDFFNLNGIQVGQILLTKDVMDNDNKRNNVFNTISALISQGIIPIINENDSVATDEIQFGDNDLLASMVASIMSVDALIILTDQDGVYDHNPLTHPDAILLSHISEISQARIDEASDALDEKGKGGIKSKLMAAKRCLDVGILTIIANGNDPDILNKIITEKIGGTWIQ